MYQSRRMILRGNDLRRRVFGFAIKLNLELINEDVLAGAVPIHTWTWSVRHDVQLGYAEDLLANEAYLRVVAASPNACSDFSTLVVGYFQPWDTGELLSAAQEAEPGPELADAVLRAGVGAPTVFDPDFFLVIADAIQHPDVKVRRAGVVASSYMLWPEFVEPLSAAASDKEPDEGVRVDAHNIRDLLLEGTGTA